jgi:hypothetical protein
VVHAAGRPEGVVGLTTEQPARSTVQGKAPAAVIGRGIDAVVEVTAEGAVDELRSLHPA